ncbi:MAG: segregation/condensation protein A [Gomphosphaeria aponina SAG 52.96 = DSM 107014]|uniref:Segregation and condensation protein A n=1 Tax=Gomphosphaeria aponina SAG 52.96 = DSM 107014 TaxID=1521640 RepID=A0A941GSX6_9CHRO|nr:segregation/condensation protein A [Gomphosphaeria aponina SAG 52.96 = DSM 107014]
MAQQGEIDPWDVQVIEVIDRFLSELGLTGDTAPEEADLPQSGQVFLWASMLVLLKADTLELIEEEEEEEYLLEEEASTSETPRELPVLLERNLRRRLGTPPIRRRRVTLKELIEQIEQIATELAQTPARRRRTPTQSRKETARTITDLAHNENLTEVAALLEQFLKSDWPAIAGGKDCIDLDELLHWWRRAVYANNGEHQEVNGQTHDQVGVFWGLLLLCAQSKVELWQSEFYQDLQIKPISE